MFRKMRRYKQQLTNERCQEVLTRQTSGVLAVYGDEGYPYAVPLSYVYAHGKIFFHCAKSGHKLDAIRSNPKVSFCVVDKDEVVSAEYTTYFGSVIVFGIARVLSESEKTAAARLLGKKYAPNDGDDHLNDVIQKELAAMEMVEITIDHMTGKEAKELIK